MKKSDEVLDINVYRQNLVIIAVSFLKRNFIGNVEIRTGIIEKITGEIMTDSYTPIIDALDNKVTLEDIIRNEFSEIVLSIKDKSVIKNTKTLSRSQFKYELLESMTLLGYNEAVLTICKISIEFPGIQVMQMLRRIVSEVS